MDTGWYIGYVQRKPFDTDFVVIAIMGRLHLHRTPCTTSWPRLGVTALSDHINMLSPIVIHTTIPLADNHFVILYAFTNERKGNVAGAAGLLMHMSSRNGMPIINNFIYKTYRSGLVVTGMNNEVHSAIFGVNILPLGERYISVFISHAFLL